MANMESLGTRSQKRALAQRRNDITAVLAHPPSMRFLCSLLTTMKYFDDPDAGNTNSTFKNIGLQAAGRFIVEDLRSVDPNALIKLLQAATAARDQHDSGEKRDDDDY